MLANSFKSKKSKLQQGYRKYDQNQSLNKDPIAKAIDDKTIFKKDLSKYKYASGIVAFFVILIVGIAIFCFAYFYSNSDAIASNPSRRRLKLVDSINIAFIICFLICLMWWILRQNFSLKAKYSGMKFWHFLTLKEKRKEKKLVASVLAINHIDNFDEYQVFVALRKKHATMWFYISLAFYGTGFLITTFLAIFLK